MLPFRPANVGRQGSVEDDRRAVMSYVRDAFEEAKLDGIEPDCVMQVAIFTALFDLVDVYGEEATADYVARLAERVRSGEFSAPRPAH